MSQASSPAKPQSGTGRNADSGGKPSSERASDLRPAQDLLEYAQTYAREKPDVAALWCFGIGFVVGWKLKPW